MQMKTTSVDKDEPKVKKTACLTNSRRKFIIRQIGFFSDWRKAKRVEIENLIILE